MLERVHRDVAGVGDLQLGEGRDVLHLVVRPQQPRRLAHVRRAEAGARPVAHAAVERDAHHGDVRAADVLETRQQGERGDPGVAGDPAGVLRAHRHPSSFMSRDLAETYRAVACWATFDAGELPVRKSVR